MVHAPEEPVNFSTRDRWAIVMPSSSAPLSPSIVRSATIIAPDSVNSMSDTGFVAV
jgi:hypothetical protein